jgi:site-specific DNA-methyltransferase (adenine-specific)
MAQLPDNSVDCVVTDPPYGILKGHKIETKLDLDLLANEFYRVLKPNSFYAFFGQMPTIVDWYLAAVKAGFKFRIDIVWCKKKGGMGGNLQMKRSHEIIYIFSKGEVNYYKTKEIYSDVSQALVEYNLNDIQSVYRQLSYWKGIAQGKDLKSNTNNSNMQDNYFLEKGLGKKDSKTLGRETSNFNTVWAFTTHNLKNRNPETGQIKHPTVKSIPLLERLVELCTPENDLILDPFLGSGTTALACINTNRRFIGCEIDSEYYEIAKARIEKALEIQKSKLF